MKDLPAGNTLPAKQTRKRRDEPTVHNDSEAVPAFRQSIAALNQSPELQLIYDTAPIGLACLSTDYRYLQINRRLTEICGISVAEHIGRSVRETVPQVAEQVEKIVQTVLRTGKPVTDIEVNGQRPDQRNADRFWMTSARISKLHFNKSIRSSRSLGSPSSGRIPIAVADSPGRTDQFFR
jgi:PAS domain S-box-containing protein